VTLRPGRDGGRAGGWRTEGLRTLADVAGRMTDSESGSDSRRSPGGDDSDADTGEGDAPAAAPDDSGDATADGPRPDGDAEGGPGSAVFTDRAKLGIAIAVAGIVTAGLLDNFFTQQGAPAAGALAWALGFAMTVIVLWYVLLRPIDIGAA